MEEDTSIEWQVSWSGQDTRVCAVVMFTGFRVKRRVVQ
jgi:hypothetical protein